MSREEAAVAYRDVMLGFRDDYIRFLQAADTLSAEEKEALRGAVFGPKQTSSGSEEGEGYFFRAQIENDNQIHTEKERAELCRT